MRTRYESKIYRIGEDFSPGPLLTSIEELEQDGVLPETVLRVNGAGVVYANYNLLQHDFPQLADHALEQEFPYLRSLKGAARQKELHDMMDKWLLRNTAFISQSQARQSVVNSPITVGNEEVKAYRPPGYGRALVFSIDENDKMLLPDNKAKVFENRLLDVKGTGVAPHAEPVNGSHCNGLYRLGYAFVELIFQELLQRIFRHSKTNLQTLPHYAIIDLGFDELNGKMPATPAALMIRRAHRRPKNSGGLYPYDSTGQQVQLEIEHLLRRYGITSVNSVTTVKVWKENDELHICYGDQQIDFFSKEEKAEIERVSHYKDGMRTLSFDGINIQHTREIGSDPIQATLVDFQSYTVKERFDDPLLSLVYDKLLRWGGTIWPGEEDFVRPDPALQVPFHLVSDTGSIGGYNMGEGKMKIDSLCYGLAEDFRAKKINRAELLNTLQTYLDALTAHWKE
jgi:hypothetical protein